MRIIGKVKLTMQEVISKMKSKPITNTNTNPFRNFTIEQLESYADDLEFQIHNIKERIKTVSSEKRDEIEQKLKNLESIFDDITSAYNAKIDSIGDKISQKRSKDVK